MYDSHTHLNSDQLYPDRQQHITDFVEAWGTWLVNIWVNHERNLKTLEIRAKTMELYPNKEIFVWATSWLHPWETTWGKISSQEILEQELIQLEELIIAERDNIVALWECGIDSHFERDENIEAIQRELFMRQCELAKKYKLPIVIHSRDNFPLTLEILSEFKDLKINLHCRWYWPEEVRRAKNNFPHLWIWFCGNLTYPKAIPLRESFQACLDLDVQILLETDAPYLAAQAIRGQQNAPAWIVHLYDFVEKNFDIQQEKIEENFRIFYWID